MKAVTNLHLEELLVSLVDMEELSRQKYSVCEYLVYHAESFAKLTFYMTLSTRQGDVRGYELLMDFLGEVKEHFTEDKCPVSLGMGSLRFEMKLMQIIDTGLEYVKKRKNGIRPREYATEALKQDILSLTLVINMLVNLIEEEEVLAKRYFEENSKIRKTLLEEFERFTKTA